MLLYAVRDALLCLPDDLELQARVASLVSQCNLAGLRSKYTSFPQFTAWATYSDGGIIGPDAKATADYLSVLKTFRERCTVTGKDSEHVNRSVTRSLNLNDTYKL
jgi:protein EFR3